MLHLRVNELLLRFETNQLKTLFDCAIIVTILFSLCNNNKFAEGVLKESQGRFDRNKKFIYELSFKGKIFEKKICRECEINKYSLKIGLIELSEKPIISNVQFNPYYFFENDSQLNISYESEQIKGFRN